MDKLAAWRREGGMALALVLALIAQRPFVADALGIEGEPKAHRLLVIFVAVVILWVTEALPIPVTALLIAPALIGFGIVGSKVAFAPYADPLLFLFVGGFFIARSMQRHGLDRRLASSLLSLSVVRAKPSRLRVAFLATGALLSMWISNTATTAILAPILLGTFALGKTGGGKPGDGDTNSGKDPATGPLLGLAYACSVGGLGTLVGSPPNGIAARLIDDSLGPNSSFGFIEWAMIGMPTALILLVIVIVFTGRASKENRGAALASVVADSKESAATPPKKWSRGERTTAAALLLAIVGWTSTGLWKASGSEAGVAFAAALPGGAVALLACVVLFVVRDEKKELVLPWNDAVKIDWGIILLFGGGIALGTQMRATGLAQALAESFVSATGIEGLWTLTAVVTVFTIFFTEACSNTASATMLVPLVISIAEELGVSIMPPALAVGLAASCAFVLPIATGPNAIVYGTGRVDLRSMMRTGLGLNLICAVAIVVLLRILLPLYGWMN
ncbi:MAG: sodium-dependent dicarboxylate transporter 2/3/5 [Polyangiales bacterium]|jgi:sodium-dependent dicarboxylate transporter 2/3/5